MAQTQLIFVTNYRWKAGSSQTLTIAELVLIQPKSAGKLYTERNHAISANAYDDGLYFKWIFEHVPYEFYQSVLDDFGFVDGSPFALATIQTRMEDRTTYNVYNVTMLKPALEQDIQTALGRWINMSIIMKKPEFLNEFTGEPE